ncbi:MAG: glycosyltransferase [Acidimicrobiales bacterium]|jgi:hypothetical protein|nr:glycosyltransferase [Acidimicrobiales bacterium]
MSRRLAPIVVTPDRVAVVEPLLAALAAQTIAAELEVVLVGPMGLRDAPLPVSCERFGSVVVVEVEDFRPAPARAAGVFAATADVVAFTEDHCFPAPGWAEALLAAYEEGYEAVGPLLCNANPRTATSWVNFLLEYADWCLSTQQGDQRHLPGHNSSFDRALLVAYGDRLGEVLEMETPEHWRLTEDGHRFGLAPDAQVAHLNFDVIGPTLRLRYLCGRQFGARRTATWPVHRRVAYAAAAPAIAGVRLRRLAPLAREVGATGRRGFWPLLVANTAVDAVAQGVGALAGAGTTEEELPDLDFGRERFMVGI